MGSDRCALRGMDEGTQRGMLQRVLQRRLDLAFVRGTCHVHVEGTEVVPVALAEALDDWQRFARDIAARRGAAPGAGVRLIMTGTAGTGKSRTIRAI